MNIKVELRNNALDAVATVKGGIDDLKLVAGSIILELKSQGVVLIPPIEEIEKALKSASPEALEDGVVVAGGIPSTPGSDSSIIWYIPNRNPPTVEGKELFNVYKDNLVYPGDLIAVRLPPSPGEPGKNLLGQPVPAIPGKDIKLVASKGVISSEENYELRSAVYGFAIVVKNIVRVFSGIHVSEDMMHVHMHFIPDPKDNLANAERKLVEALEVFQIKRGVDHDAIKNGIAEANSTGKVVFGVEVAKGLAPVNGRESGYKVVFDTAVTAGKELEGGKFDFRESEHVKNVSKGTKLAEIVPASDPIPGYRIDGVELKPTFERSEGLKPGDNTIMEEEGRYIVANTDGVLVVRGGKFHVLGEYRVQGDVDYRTGNIRSSGSVRIMGEVKPGFVVESQKNIDILGNVEEETTIISGGDLNITGGLANAKKCICGKSMTVRYIHNSAVEVQENLEVKLSIANSEVFVNGKLTANGPKSAIVGGQVSAKAGMDLYTLGSPSAPTYVSAGVDIKVIQELEALDKEMKLQKEELLNIQRNLGSQFLKDPKSAILVLPPALRKPKLDLLQKMKDVHIKYQQNQTRTEELKSRNTELKDARITVNGEVHKGTVVRISRSTVTIPETLRHVYLFYDKDREQVAWRKL